MEDHRSGIARLGFRRWYERQLIESHVCLVTCFLCGLLLAVCLEGALPKDGVIESPGSLLVGFAAVIGTIRSWGRYRYVFERAERYGSVAHCASCGSYARFEVERSKPGERPDEPRLEVRCRKCGHRWNMPGAGQPPAGDAQSMRS
jgi:DNA-directed RNA polymerase subunit RPC12/RpoP